LTLTTFRIGEKIHILVTHDECLFYSNDDRPIVWAPLGKPPLRKKGQGRSIMVSEFLTESKGRLRLTDDIAQQFPHIKDHNAHEFLNPGKNQEGWWTSKHLLKQVVEKAIPIFEAVFPGCIAVFAFDNSTNHNVMADNALNVNQMNLGPGGKKPAMHLTFFGPDNTFQSMVFSADYPTHPNQPKGMRQVLSERGLWRQGLLAICALCKSKNKGIKHDVSRTNCCAHRILSLQPDFLAERSELELAITTAGHKCIFYPKYHCELNFIEMYWGACKRYTRERCDYTYQGLKRVVPEALNSVSLLYIRKFAQLSWRYMNLYRAGLTGKLAEYGAKRYKSHRCVPKNVVEELTKEIEERNK